MSYVGVVKTAAIHIRGLTPVFARPLALTCPLLRLYTTWNKKNLR